MEIQVSFVFHLNKWNFLDNVGVLWEDWWEISQDLVSIDLIWNLFSNEENK